MKLPFADTKFWTFLYTCSFSQTSSPKGPLRPKIVNNIAKAWFLRLSQVQLVWVEKEARSSVEHDSSHVFFLVLGWTKTIVSPSPVQNKPKWHCLYESLEQVSVPHWVASALQLPQFSFLLPSTLPESSALSGAKEAAGKPRAPGDSAHSLTTSRSNMDIYRS